MMKRIVYILAAAFIMFAGCAKEGSGVSGNSTELSFNVALTGKALSKVDGVSEAASVDTLDVFIYDENGEWIDTAEPVVTQGADNLHYNVKVKLVRNVVYNFVFFAQKKGTYAFSADKKTLGIDYNSLLCNKDSLDAFYARENNYKVTGAFTKNITLYRPFAQINFGSVQSDYAAAVASKVDFTSGTLKSAIKLSSVADTLHLLDGTTSGSVDAQFMLNDWQGDTLTVSGATDTPVHYIAMTYVLASTDKEMVNEVRLDVAGKQNGIDFAIDHEIANVPIQRNYRTNIIGDIFSIEGQFNIIIDPIYNTPDHDKNLQ